MRFLISVLFVLACTCQTVAAQETRPTFLINLFGHTVSYAPPPWMRGNDPTLETEIFRQQRAGPNGTEVFIMEYIPVTSTFDDWTELYAIHAETPLSGSVEEYVAGMHGQFSSVCADTHLQVANTTPDNAALFVIYCTSYVDRPDLGEVAIVLMQLSGNALIKNYYERRVPAYSISSLQTALPIGQSDLINAMITVGAMRVD